ncbi:MAG: class I SAM-dependent methyltransferase [Proteobacteria bacterium]|nr:class I SAM-dependent methyltransferase [Pseudomonadota bacterium]MBU1389684.1 class I SAM-dependent methyltransferase [Pseudomonadota bacterium]MBU1542622.1 class I SAM-dependent methyltransferase [Pseudomonadota bacterium]MBU2482939.1 class I SAM-dependent methyltransferase [Pseudomonadota bacterium]
MIPNSFRFQKHIPGLLAALNPVLIVLDIVLIPFCLIGGLLFYLIRLIDINHLESMKFTKMILRWIGVYPVLDHFYDPLVNLRHLKKPFDHKRDLPGFDLNIQSQLNLLDKFDFNADFETWPMHFQGRLEYYYINFSFLPVDAQYLHNMIRLYKPKRFVEIGCGFSTLVSANALSINKARNAKFTCQHTCIEPYRHEWLNHLDIQMIKEPVQNLDKAIFEHLEANDILFIDSSHMIKPQGDVLYEYLEILPVLKPGVIVHIHDIYTPKDYPEKHIVSQVKFWNEQYLLEAFLSSNSNFEILGALNYLRDNHHDALAARCPALKDKRIIEKAKEKIACSSLDFLETTSFWIQKK